MAKNGINLKSLFADYAKAESAVQAARTAEERATAARSATVKAIFDAGGSGPFSYDGRILTAVKRTAKIKDAAGNVTGEGPANWFFKSAGGDITEV